MLVTILLRRSFTVPPVHRNCCYFPFGSSPFFSKSRILSSINLSNNSRTVVCSVAAAIFKRKKVSRGIPRM